MFPFIGDDLLQDRYTRLVPQRLELFAILGNVSPLVDLFRPPTG